MNELEQKLLEAELGVSPGNLRICIRSRMRIDAGRWWRTTPLWVGATGEDLVLFAVARRKYIERVPLVECHESRYCAESGRLVLAPVESLRFRRIAMRPSDALTILRLIRE